MAISTTTSGGTTTSFSNTPQAKDDLYTASALTAQQSGGLTEDTTDTVFYLDVMFNDLGGNAKTLWSLDNAMSDDTSTKLPAPADLLSQDIVGADNFSRYGALIEFTATGKVAYSMTADSIKHFQSLAAGQVGEDSFTYAIRLGNGTLSWATVTLQITGTNDAPVVTGAVIGTAIEDGVSSTLNALANATDVDKGATLTVTNLPAALPAGVTYNATTHSFTLDPSNAAFQRLAKDATITASVTYSISDGITSTAASVSWTVTGTNDAPVAYNATNTTSENAILNSQVPMATDVDGTIASYTLATGTGTGNGTVTLSPSGSYSFTPGTDFDALANNVSRNVSFTYYATDNFGTNSASQTVTITVTGTNDAPVAYNATNTTSENAILNSQVPMATDVDGTIASYTLATGTGTGNGTVTLSPSGSYSFTPGTDFDALANNVSRNVSFTYYATDNFGTNSASQTVDLANKMDKHPLIRLN